MSARDGAAFLAFIQACGVRHKSPLWSHSVTIKRGFNLLVFAFASTLHQLSAAFSVTG